MQLADVSVGCLRLLLTVYMIDELSPKQKFMLLNIKIEPSYVTQQDEATEVYAACTGVYKSLARPGRKQATATIL